VRRYVIITFSIVVVFLAVIFLVSQNDTNVPFLYGLY